MCKIPGMSGKQARLQQMADATAKMEAEAKQNQVQQSQQSGPTETNAQEGPAQVAPGVTVLGQDLTLEGRYAGIGTRNVRMSAKDNKGGRNNATDPSVGDGGGDGGGRKKKRVSTGLGL